MLTVYKYVLPSVAELALSLPQGAQVLHFDVNTAAQISSETYLAIWALVDPDQPLEQRRFLVLGTGAPVVSAHARYFGTTIDRQRGLVWHLFELGADPATNPSGHDVTDARGDDEGARGPALAESSPLIVPRHLVQVAAADRTNCLFRDEYYLFNDEWGSPLTRAYHDLTHNKAVDDASLRGFVINATQHIAWLYARLVAANKGQHGMPAAPAVQEAPHVPSPADQVHQSPL